MRTEHLLLSLFALILGFFLVFGGLFFAFFPNITFPLRETGVLLFCSGILLFVAFFLLSRRRYLIVEMGGVAIHEKLICYFTKETLISLFPGQPLDCDVVVHRKGKVEVLAHIPYSLEKSQEEMLDQIETVLAAALLKYCGWRGSFIFNVSFSRSVLSP